jgi:hypothetical protein
MKKEKKAKNFDRKRLEKYLFIEKTLDYLENNGCGLENVIPFPDEHPKLYKASINERKKNLQIAIAGYGGSRKDIRAFPTPLQTEYLPTLFEHWNKISEGNGHVPLLILGYSFDEVFLRKIRLLSAVIPDLRLIQFINVMHLKDSRNESLRKLYAHYQSMNDSKFKDERYDLKAAVVEYLKEGGDLDGRTYEVLDVEVPAGEGTIKSESIDILALESKSKWLTVIELKYVNSTNRHLRSVIFQGLDYCNWAEDYKKGLAMLYPEHHINTRKRTKLILINGPGKFPSFHEHIARASRIKDRYQEIELYYTNDSIPLTITPFFTTRRSIISLK